MGARLATIRAGDEVFSYFANGSGPLALLLHGFPDVPQSLLPLADAFSAAGYRVALPWLRGYAPSPLGGPYGPLALGADALALASALAPDERVYVVGHDWGAIAAYAAAGLDPGRIAALAALSIPHPAALVRAVWRHPAQLLRSAYIAGFQIPRLPERALAASPRRATRAIWSLWSPGLAMDPALETAVASCLEASLPAPLEHYRALAEPREIRALLRAITPLSAPTLQIHGRRDRCVGAALGRAQTGAFAAPLERVEIPEAGHFVHVEATGAVARAALGHFAAHPA